MHQCKNLLRNKYTSKQIEEFHNSSNAAKVSPIFLQFLRTECVKIEEKHEGLKNRND